jgi:hypothetical protein
VRPKMRGERRDWEGKLPRSGFTDPHPPTGTPAEPLRLPAGSGERQRVGDEDQLQIYRRGAGEAAAAPASRRVPLLDRPAQSRDCARIVLQLLTTRDNPRLLALSYFPRKTRLESYADMPRIVGCRIDYFRRLSEPSSR